MQTKPSLDIQIYKEIYRVTIVDTSQFVEKHNPFIAYCVLT